MRYRFLVSSVSLLALASVCLWTPQAVAEDNVGALDGAPDSGDDVGAFDGASADRNDVGGLEEGAVNAAAEGVERPARPTRDQDTGVRTEPDSMPAYPRDARRLGFDNDDDFSGANEVQAPPNTNPDMRQLQNAIED